MGKRDLLSKRYRHHKHSYLPLQKSQEQHRKQLLDKLLDGTYVEEKRNCPVCGSYDSDIIAERDRYSLPVQTHICNACGLLRTNPCMREQDLVDFYKNHYRALYEGSAKPTADHFKFQVANRGKPLLKFYNQHAPAHDKGLVLEVGSGCGGILYPFKEAGYDVVGLDFDEEYIQYGIEKGMDLREGDIHNVKLAQKPQLIIYSHVLEHVHSLEKELRRIHELLDDNGFVLIEVPGIYHIGLKTSYLGDFLLYLQNAHLYHFTLSTLCNIMKKYGFELIYGDEVVRAIFKKAPANARVEYKNEAKPIDNFLIALERKQMRPAMKAVRPLFRFVLRFKGLMRFARTIYRKLMRKG